MRPPGWATPTSTSACCATRRCFAALAARMHTMFCAGLGLGLGLGTVQSLQDAAAWLGYTYLYVRMLCNPQVLCCPGSSHAHDVLCWFRARARVGHGAEPAGCGRLAGLHLPLRPHAVQPAGALLPWQLACTRCSVLV